MEAAILSVMALMLTVMLYLDRTRRADIGDVRTDHAGLRADMNAESAALRADMNAESAALRKEMAENTAALRKEMAENTAALRKDMNDGFTALRKEMADGFARTDARIDQLTAAVINLAENLGQVKGRTEVLVTTE